MGTTVQLVCGVKAQSWLGIWGLADCTYCVSSQEEHLQEHKSYLFRFASVAPWAEAGPSPAQKCISTLVSVHLLQELFSDFFSNASPVPFGPSMLPLFREAWLFLDTIVHLTSLTASQRQIFYLIHFFFFCMVPHLKKNFRYLSRTYSSVFDRNINREKKKPKNKLILCLWGLNPCEKNHSLDLSITVSVLG